MSTWDTITHIFTGAKMKISFLGQKKIKLWTEVLKSGRKFQFQGEGEILSHHEVYPIIRKFYIGLIALNLLSLLCRHTEFKRMKSDSECHYALN